MASSAYDKLHAIAGDYGDLIDHWGHLPVQDIQLVDPSGKKNFIGQNQNQNILSVSILQLFLYSTFLIGVLLSQSLCNLAKKAQQLS